MYINKLKQQATTLNLTQMAQIKGGSNNLSTAICSIIVDVDVI